MNTPLNIIRRPGVLVGALMAAILSISALFLTAGGRGVNPRADFWGGVREGMAGYTSTGFDAHRILIQSAGQNWREVRNGLVAGISPWILGGVLAVILLFFVIVGQDKLERPPSGIRLRRYSLAERILHWYTALLFILLALTGLSVLFGRAVLIPPMGQGLFAAYLQWAKWIHNVAGPLFLAGLLIEIIAWIRENIPHKRDLVWFKNLGGMIGKGPRPHAGKINGGEKAWFWLMVVSGILVGATGIILDFPIWGQTRETMQIAQVIHASVGILFLAASFGHIYIGTIGAQGTFEGMWRGDVDAEWARQHQDLWYESKMAARDQAGET